MAGDVAANRVWVCAMSGTDYLRWRVNDFWGWVEELRIENGKVSHRVDLHQREHHTIP